MQPDPGRSCVFFSPLRDLTEPELAKQLDEMRFEGTEPDAQTDPAAALDVSILQERVLGPIFDIDDPRTSERITFVGGIEGAVGLERRAGTDGVAFSLFPTTIDDLKAVSDAGLLMPPKSTWFEPKLRSGLFIRRV